MTRKRCGTKFPLGGLPGVVHVDHVGPLTDHDGSELARFAEHLTREYDHRELHGATLANVMEFAGLTVRQLSPPAMVASSAIKDFLASRRAPSFACAGRMAAVLKIKLKAEAPGA